MGAGRKIWFPRSKQPAGKPTPSHTMVRSANSWLSSATRPASSVVTRDRCIWPLLLERRLSPFLARRTRHETAHIAWVAAHAAILPATLFFAVRKQGPPTSEAADP